MLEGITGIPGLMADESWRHGGLFEAFPRTKEEVRLLPTVHSECEALARRLCVVLYVTPTSQLTGELEFWSTRDFTPHRRTATIMARHNRMVIFETSILSWHGHPSYLQWGDLTRRSIIAYYYSPYFPTNHITLRKKVAVSWI